MTDGIRLVRDIGIGTVHRADCPVVLALPAQEIAAFEGLEKTLVGEVRQGPLGSSQRCVRWCTCVASAVTGALARYLDEAFANDRSAEPPSHAELVRVLRGVAAAYERGLPAFADRMRDGEKPPH